MANSKSIEVKKDYKLRVKFDGSRTATIYTPGMPFVIDIVDNILNKISSYKEEEIEIIGDQPENWKVFFPDPVVEVAEAISA